MALLKRGCAGSPWDPDLLRRIADDPLRAKKKLRRKGTELDLFEKRNDFTHLRWSLSLENLR
nr:hypothetical protein GCM10025699_45040 [Microbacterium flavescens]